MPAGRAFPFPLTGRLRHDNKNDGRPGGYRYPDFPGLVFRYPGFPVRQGVVNVFGQGGRGRRDILPGLDRLFLPMRVVHYGRLPLPGRYLFLLTGRHGRGVLRSLGSCFPESPVRRGIQLNH